MGEKGYHFCSVAVQNRGSGPNEVLKCEDKIRTTCGSNRLYLSKCEVDYMAQKAHIIGGGPKLNSTLDR
ncbi:unnamed protein product [Sphenostylis stenocarpa]|uniref:Uncharacterized protein n=1 Tax=Sphenostylis stenocarpa TaxID=92480 RepID=A0AA86SYM3_9FABA|nr:unnamed protein product [Sphenostylis stenocarpa]